MKLDYKNCFKVGISAFILFLCIHYWTRFAGLVKIFFVAAMPLIIGGAIAYVINILMRFYEKHYFKNSKSKFIEKSRRPVCLLLSFLTLFALVFLLIRLVVPQLIESITLIVNEAPNTFKNIVKKAEKYEWVDTNWLKSLDTFDWKSKIDKVVSTVTKGFGNAVGVVFGVLSTVFSSVVTFLLAVIFSIYLLTDKEKIGSQLHRLMRRYMSESVYKKVNYVLDVMDDSFSSYIVGQCFEAIILGSLCTIGMLILGMPYAPMIGAVMSFTALIPVAGSFIGAGVGTFMILTVSPTKALGFLIFIIVLQQLEGNIVYPKVVGSSLGLPPIWVLAAITVGGGVMGILGMLIAVPIASTIYKLIKADVKKYEMQNKRF